MYTLKTASSFDSAHFLAGYRGKCANIHGHRWQIEVSVSQKELIAAGEKRGMLIDFADLKREVKALADAFDHALIIESGSLRQQTLAALQEENFRIIEVAYRPTAENFAQDFYTRLKSKGLPVRTVAVYETPQNCAVYEEDA